MASGGFGGFFGLAMVRSFPFRVSCPWQTLPTDEEASRTTEVKINGRVLKVIRLIPQGQTRSFDMAVSNGVLVAGWNDIRAYIEWSNDDYDRGHWVSLTLALE